MIRQTIKDQLNKLQYASLENFDEATNTYFIPKYTKPTYDIGHCYIIKLKASIYGEAGKSSLVAINWNQGSAPQTAYLKIYVSKLLGNMIYVDSLGFDNNTKTDLNVMWSGWLSTADMTQVQKLS